MYRQGIAALFGVALLAFFAAGTSAADELEEARGRIRELRQRAEQLAEEGKKEAAQELRAHADRIGREAEEAQAARQRRPNPQHVRRQIRELRQAAERLAAEGKKDRAEQMLARARELEQDAERGERVVRREGGDQRERAERVQGRIRELEVAAERLADQGKREQAQDLIAQARELRADLEQSQRLERRVKRAVRRDGEGRPQEVDLPREINQAIETLREHGNTEIASALQRRVSAMLRELRGRPDRGGIQREVRRERGDARVHPEVIEALRQLRADVNSIRENPPTHPEIGHVIRDLRAQMKQLGVQTR